MNTRIYHTIKYPFFLGLALVLSFAFSDYSSGNESKTKAVSKYENSNVGVEFGRGPNCDGHSGLCSVSSGDAGRAASGSQMGTFYLNTDEELQLKILKSSINDSESTQQFDDGWFEQEEDLLLSPEVLAPLGIAAPYTIKKGVYPVSENSTYYIVDFSSSNQTTK